MAKGKMECNDKGMACKMAEMCPWKMCMCHMKNSWMAFLMMFIMNFVFLYVVFEVVKHFAAHHGHMMIIFMAVASLLAALFMWMHKCCCR